MARYRFADCELDADARSLLRSGAEVAVEPKVFDLLRYMIEQRGRFLSRAELLAAVWPGTVVSEAALSRAIKEARRAVGDDGERQAVVATLHGRGYRFVADVAAPLGAQSRADSPAHGDDPRRVPDDTTLPQARSGTQPPRVLELALSCVWPTAVPAVPLASSSKLRLGRSSDCELMLAVPDVSRVHAEIECDGASHVLYDQRSTNGTFVNGERVERAPLRAGDVLRLGDAILVVVGLEPGERGEARELHPGLVGSAVLARALAPLRAVGQGMQTVLLSGETGVGKELAARALHDWSGRPGPFVALNCAALEETTSLRALFGGEGELGVLAAARGGTLLLDHVALLPLGWQAALLRVIEHGEVLTPATGRAEALDLRVSATSQQPLDHALASGRLRADMHELLSRCVVQLPPLRERREDVPALFAHFARLRNGGSAPEVTPALIERLCLYDWPRNVRELETLVGQLLLAHAHEQPLRSAHLPAHMERRAVAQQ
jgi:DNA-binding winged helix-turn-helix (wHTH) protein